MFARDFEGYDLMFRALSISVLRNMEMWRRMSSQGEPWSQKVFAFVQNEETTEKQTTRTNILLWMGC